MLNDKVLEKLKCYLNKDKVIKAAGMKKDIHNSNDKKSNTKHVKRANLNTKTLKMNTIPIMPSQLEEFKES